LEEIQGRRSIPFHRQLTDLGVEVMDPRLVVATLVIGTVREHLAQAIHGLALLGADLIGTNLVARRDFLDCPVAP
jgi:hypothetical protein